MRGLKSLSILCIAVILTLYPFCCSANDNNAITLIEQQDRRIECHPGKPSTVKKGYSPITGEKCSENFQPILVEFYNENGGVYATAPRGITEADVIYEYLVNTNGQTGICALFQDHLPSCVGPVGDASVGGMMAQAEWNCGYVYHDLPAHPDGSVSDLGYSLQAWIDNCGLTAGLDIFPANVSNVKEWKSAFAEDASLIIEQNNYVDTNGIKQILERKRHAANKCSRVFVDLKRYKEPDDAIPVAEVDIRTASRVYSSGFVYDKEARVYARWVGQANQYGDVSADEQLKVNNVIVQRVNYSVSDKNMAPSVVGQGNADIFMLGNYIEGYWVREAMDQPTRFYDSNGEPIKFVPGSTYILLLTNSTSVVILNY